VLVTVPLPFPVFVIVKVLGAAVLNVAVQLRAADIVRLPSLQSASPVQPENAEPAEGVAVSATVSPAAKGALHVAPQLIPAGLLVTVPLPVPAFAMVNVLGAAVLNVAVQLRLADSVTLPSLQSASPVQPANVDPAVGVAVNVTTCPTANCPLHVVPQLIPAGLLVIEPVPSPALLMVRVLVAPAVARSTPRSKL
jgi:hypothetical protein